MPRFNRFVLLLIPAAFVFAEAPIGGRMKAAVEKGEVVGAVFAYSCGGKMFGPEAVGYADGPAKKPMTTDSIFQIMSMTKPVTAVGIMMLVEEGKVAITDPIEKHLPEFKGVNRNKEGRAPTVRDLLTHTSGMMGGFPPPSIPDLYTKMDRTLAEAVTLFAQHPLDFEPGTKWQYSNPGIATLGRIIEVRSGTSYEQFLEDRIFKPLGMKDSHFFIPGAKQDRVALVHAWQDNKFQYSPATILGGDSRQFRKGAKYPAPEFGMYSTAADLMAFYQAMLNGKLLSKESMRVMTEVHTKGIRAGWGVGNGFGLGWEVVQDPIGTLTLHSIGTYNHGGAFGTFGWVDPVKKMTGVWLVQQSSGNSAIARDAFLQMANSRCEY